jgi:putative transposase
MFYPKDWKSTTIDAFIKPVHEYIVWYDEKRNKILLGYLCPIENRESLSLIN